MVGNIFMVLSGLCILPLCSPQHYHIVKDAKTWTEAQRYCREKYKDLVTINSEEDMVRLSHMLWDHDDEFWIGLYGDFNNWKWSMERKGFYKEEAELKIWDGTEPNQFSGDFVCVDIRPTGGWSDYGCNGKRPFVCYSEVSETRFIHVGTEMTWTDAQRYCREHYTDLARVRSTAENDEISRLVETFSWIGLYRESWKWSDGQRMRMTSFSSWNEGQPDKIIDSCVTTTHSKWNARLCNSRYAFVCTDSVFKQRVKVMLRISDSSVDLEEMQDSILQQLNQRREVLNLSEVKLRWIVQPDGKIFHLKEAEEEKEKEKVC